MNEPQILVQSPMIRSNTSNLATKGLKHVPGSISKRNIRRATVPDLHALNESGNTPGSTNVNQKHRRRSDKAMDDKHETWEKHRLPAYNLFSGNLPVVTTSFHRPSDGSSVGATPYEHFSGNLPIISTVLHATGGRSKSFLQPGWVPLQEASGKHFWWNTRFLTRRERRPTPIDDGSLPTVPYQGPMWIEEFDFRPEAKQRYYINMKTGKTQWEKPIDFDKPGNGTPYQSTWVTHWDHEKNYVLYFNQKTLTTVTERPELFDGIDYQAQWERLSRAQIRHKAALIAHEKQKNAVISADAVLCSDGTIRDALPNISSSKGLTIPNWVRASQYDVRLSILDGVEHGSPHEVFYVNALSGEIRRDPPDDPTALITDMLRTNSLQDTRKAVNSDTNHKPHRVPSFTPPPPPPDAGNYEEPLQDDDPATWGMRMFYDFSSSVLKRGGGRSFMGRTKAQKRYLVLRDGKLSYFKSEAEAHADNAKPQKNMLIDVNNYTIDQMPAHDTMFRLIPIPDHTALTYSRNPKMSPHPERIYELEVENRALKEQWLEALGETTILMMDAETDETTSQ